MLKDRAILVLYTTAICNLKCRYCFIDKNPALKEIDDLLDRSFLDDNYYLNFCKEIFPKNQLKEVQLWGGEPSMGYHRIYKLLDSLISYYPNLTDFMGSTNLTPENFCEEFFGLLDVLGKYPHRNFNFSLQLSLDGPIYINDINRGKGVTEKFTKTFIKFIQKLPEKLLKYPNIKIQAHFKPTLDSWSINKLQTKETIINYYQFFERYKKMAFPAELKTKGNFNLGLTVPNTACPSPHTQEDGIKFANLVKLTREIEKENIEKKYFQFYKEITPFGNSRFPQKTDWSNYGACGSGQSVIGLLPNDIISTCHNGFTTLISDYKNYCESTNYKLEKDISIDDKLFKNGNIQNDMVFPKEKLKDYEQQVEVFYNNNECFEISNLAGTIQFLALCGQIDPEFKSIENAKRGANLIAGRTCICIRDNIGVTGSKYLFPVGLMKLLLNGAHKYLLKEGDIV